MSYVRKLATSALVIAAAFAVAFAVLISTAEAEIRTLEGTSFTEVKTVGGATAGNGDTRYVQHDADGFVRFEISTTGSASASFTHADADDDGQAITCSDAADTAKKNCDADPAGTGVTVALKIDDDSGKGVVFIKQTRLTGTGGDAEVTEAIKVSVSQVPTSLSVKAKKSSIDAETGSTYVDIRLTDENGAGIALEELTVVSTRATLATVVGTDNAKRELKFRGVSEVVMLTLFEGASLAGSVITTVEADTEPKIDGKTGTVVDSRGYARVVVAGAGSPGISTITVTAGDVTGTTDIVLHGAVKSISAVLEQGAIAIGGKTRIVVTAIDAGDNPVADQEVSVKRPGGVNGPEKLAILVDTNETVNKNVAGSPNTLTGIDLPSCVPHTGTEDNQGTADADESRPASSGTNADGKCVIEVSAPGGDTETKTDDAARGTHTIVIVASDDGSDGPKGVNEVELEVEVGGAPTTIETDAPARIDPSDELTINVTVLDDETVRVGAVLIEVIHTAGDGAVITDIASKTSDGRAKFTYLAPSRPGVVEFLVRTRDKPADEAGSKVTSKEAIIIAIGDEPVEPVEVVVPPPAAPSLSKQPAATGFTLVTFSGGTIGELAEAVEAACGTGGRVYATDYLGRWVSYIPAAMMGPVNAAFEQLFPDGIPANTPLLVGGCSG